MKGNVFLKSENQFAAHWGCLFAHLFQFTVAVPCQKWIIFVVPLSLQIKEEKEKKSGACFHITALTPLEAFGEVPTSEQGSETHSWRDNCGINGAFKV